MRNVKTVNWTDGSKAKALANLGGGPRPTPKNEKGVPIYFHDWFGAGRHAMVVSIKSGEFKADPTTFRDEPNLTGDESRVAEVKDVAFPAFPDLVDDLPPATVITQRQQEGREARRSRHHGRQRHREARDGERQRGEGDRRRTSASGRSRWTRRPN